MRSFLDNWPTSLFTLYKVLGEFRKTDLFGLVVVVYAELYKP